MNQVQGEMVAKIYHTFLACYYQFGITRCQLFNTTHVLVLEKHWTENVMKSFQVEVSFHVVHL